MFSVRYSRLPSLHAFQMEWHNENGCLPSRAGPRWCKILIGQAVAARRVVVHVVAVKNRMLSGAPCGAGRGRSACGGLLAWRGRVLTASPARPTRPPASPSRRVGSQVLDLVGIDGEIEHLRPLRVAGILHELLRVVRTPHSVGTIAQLLVVFAKND